MPRSKTQDSTPAIDAIKLLKQQHREVEEIFVDLEDTSDRAHKKRSQLIRKLVIALEAHTWIEEKLLYPAAQEVEMDQTLEAYEEHQVIHYMLSRIVETDPSDEAFLPRVKVLKEIVAHHVEEEESEFFPDIQRKLGARRLADLGIEMHDEFRNRTHRLQSRETEQLVEEAVFS